MDIFARALASLGSGYMAGQDQADAKARQQRLDDRQRQLDAEAQQQRDRQFGVEQSQGSLARANAVISHGLTPTDGMPLPGDYTAPSGGNPMLGGGIMGSLTGGLQNAAQAPTVGMTDETGTTTSYRMPPLAPKLTPVPQGTVMLADGKPVFTNPAKETPDKWTVSGGYTVGGKHMPVRINADGSEVTDLQGNPIDPASLKTYEVPQQPSYTILQPASPGEMAQAVNTRNPRDVVPLPFAKGGTGGGGAAPSALTMMALSRVRQLASDLESVHPQMSAFEDQTNPENITKVSTPMRMTGTIANQQPNIESRGGAMELLGNTLSSGAQGIAQNRLNATPLGLKYRLYTFNGKKIGMDLAETLPRPNNALIGMEQSLSTADVGNPNPELTASVQHRRAGALAGAKAILALNPAFIEEMQKQDPSWISRVIKTSIETGAAPSFPPDAYGGDAAPSGAMHPDAKSLVDQIMGGKP